MKAWLMAALVAATALGGCGRLGDSPLNPANWFGGSTAERTLPADQGGPTADGRRLVDQVAQLQVDRMPGGAIVTAVGLPPTQGWWEADLVPVTAAVDGDPLAEAGAIELEFRIAPPPGPRRQGAPPSREVTAALFISDRRIAGVDRITVRGLRNQRTTRR